MKQLPILLLVVAACVFAAGGAMAGDNTRNDAARAIDGKLATSTALTPARTTGWQTAIFDLGKATRINRLRVAPIVNVDGVGAAVDRLDLVIVYTTDSGGLEKRRFRRVSNLVNGFKSTESAVADAVSPAGAITGVHHSHAAKGYYSLTFDAVKATAVGVQFARAAGDDQPWCHFHVREVEAYDGSSKAAITGVRVFSGARVARSADSEQGAAEVNPPGCLTALPLGNITAEGWLKAQLERNKAGMGGQMDELEPEMIGKPFVDRNHKSRAGHPFGRLPGWSGEFSGLYWTGLVQLAFTLDDKELKAKAGKWVKGVLALQEKDGYLGNYRKNENRMEDYSAWSANCGYRALLSWYDATGDKAVLEALHRGLLWFVKNWAGDRKTNYAGPILMDSMIAVYLRTGDKRLYQWCLDYIAWLDKHDKWHHGMASLRRPELQYGEDHPVAFGDNVKNPALIYQVNGRREYLDASRNGLKQIMSKAWQCTGAPSSNKERHSPPSADHETEYCNFESYLNTFAHMARITGSAEYGDFMERILFNAAQGARKKDERAIAYMTSPNQLLATMDSTRYGCLPSYGVYAPCHFVACCPTRSVIVYPMFVRALCMRDADENLYLPAYGPCEIRFASGTGARIDIREETAYPFSDKITLKIKTSRPWKRKLMLKIPAWCKKHRVELNGKPVAASPTADGYLPVEHQWRDDTLSIRLEMTPRVVAVRDVYFPKEPLRTIQCGPLLFSLRVPENWKPIPGKPLTPLPEGWSWYEARPRAKLDDLPYYSLDLAALKNGAAIEKRYTRSAYPWDDSPLKLKVPMRRSKQAYQLKTGKQVRVDRSNPLACRGAAEMVELVPYGCTILRLTCFTVCNKDESR